MPENHHSIREQMNRLCQVISLQSRPIKLSCLVVLAVTFVYSQQGLFDNAVPRRQVSNKCRRIPNSKSQNSSNNKVFLSSLCNCGKEIEIFDESAIQSDDFQWCSEESSIRGPNQKIVTYSLYGDAHNASVFKRYFSLLNDISLTVEKQYPGWIVRIYHNIRDRPGPEKEAHNTLCDVYCRFNHVDLCSVPLMADRIGNDTTPIDPKLLLGLNPKMLRYLVMMDPNVDVFISRDVDRYIIPFFIL